MSKIIIHNNAEVGDLTALFFVQAVIREGFVSGENQYCWITEFGYVRVHAKPTRGTTHTFEVRDI